MSKRLWCCLVLVACGGESTKPESPASVAVSPAALDLTPGGTSQLTASPKSASGATLTTPVTWSSSSDAVATVTSAGLVTAVSTGSATITARSGSVTGTAAVTVSPVAVASVVVTPASATIEVGDTTRARAATRSATGTDLTGRTLTWTSAEPTLATVAQTGLITGVTAGTTTITATSEGRTAALTLTVTPAAVATVSVASTTGTIAVGTTRQLVATLNDARGAPLANRTVSWTSADPATISVSTTGIVTAVKPGGPVTISATSEGKQGTLALAAIPVPAARVAVSAPAPDMNEGSTVQLTAVATDSAGVTQAARTFSWVSDSAQIATVDANGLVRAHRTGSVRIRARADAAEGSVNLVVRGLIHRWTFDESGGPGTTFRDDVRGRVATLTRMGSRSGIATGGQVTLAGGAPPLTDFVALPGGLLRPLADATIEVWGTMHSYQFWSRVFDVSGAGNLFMAWSQATTPGTDYVAFKVGTTEHRIQNAMANYTTDIQHHIVMAIDQGGGTGGLTRITLYLDGVRTGGFDTPHTLAALDDSRFWLGRSFLGAETAHASYDEVRIHDRVYPAGDIQASYQRGPVRTATATTLSIVSPAGIGDTIRGINTMLQLNVAASDAQGRRFPVSGARWTSANANATVDSTGRVHVRSSGTVDIAATVGSTTLRWSAAAVHMRRLRVDPFLATPAAGAIWEIPVVIVAYIPTADARTIDLRKSSGFWDLQPASLDTMEQHVLDYARRVKLAREQGSRYRGYKDPLALPSIGLRITDVFVTYDHIPASAKHRDLRIKGGPAFPDYHRVFADLGLIPYMQARGTKEVWDAWSYFDEGFPSFDPTIQSPADARAFIESNMSSPTTGDISNSFRTPDDLPLIGHTWTMYSINIRASQAQAIHNVGHQMESILGYAAQRQDGNANLFWRDFVGLDASYLWAPGRAGATHFPPNATGDYDYHNTRVVQSDIEDWTPANAGQKTAISRSTWYNLAYPWPGVASFGEREESQWYVYWFQNFPGRGNRIPRGSAWMTNWWAFVGDWDGSIRSGLGLYSGTPAANVGAGEVYPFSASRVAAPKPWVHKPEPRAPRK